MESTLELKTINELQQFSFFVPAYQRGYRWTAKEVTELLNDINDFNPKIVNEETNEKTWYCLQPVVVREKNNNTYELIDGQQRLTTIFLILYYLNQDYIIEKRDRIFEINYETRTKTKELLESIQDNSLVYDTIDSYYIMCAYNTISKWFSSRNINFDIGNFRSKLKFNSKVIWYESIREDSISIFTRINIGKIPLTNAELIKALFLNSSNFEKNNPEKLRLKQLEIATEWDNIELTLQKDRFWHFLTDKKLANNRIEFIFDLMNEKEDKNDPLSTFRFFSEKFQLKSAENLEKSWSQVKDYFQRFNEWYNERDLYHKIGFLIYINETTIKELYIESTSKTKTEFKIHIDRLIKNSFRNVSLEDLQYGDKHVKNVLLLYNILTMLNSEKDNSYFPFDLFREEKWDIEHITSVKDSIPDKIHRKDWLQDALLFIDTTNKTGKELIKSINKFNNEDEDQFIKIFQDIVSHFNSGIKDEDLNDISNLTLLDSETNRGYKNAVFPFKRKTIINRDKSGVFIPICTKNVFLKYFSDYPPKISFWTQDDREKYEEDIYKVLSTYLNN